MKVDNIEDFEFKPITEGLGFHKKKELDSEVKKTSSENIPTFELPELQITLPKKEFKEKSLNLNTNESVDVTDKLFTHKSLPRETKPHLQVPKFQGPKFSKPNQEKISLSKDLAQIIDKPQISNKVNSEIKYKYSEAAPSFLSLFLDATVIAGLSMLLTLCLIYATGIDLIKVVSNPLDMGAQIGLALLIYSSAQLYYLILRTFFGQTLGEWALEHQLGLQEEQQRVSYIFKLIFRNILYTLTGFLLIPLLSGVFKKDIAGKLSGIRIYRQEQV